MYCVSFTFHTNQKKTRMSSQTYGKVAIVRLAIKTRTVQLLLITLSHYNHSQKTVHRHVATPRVKRHGHTSLVHQQTTSRLSSRCQCCWSCSITMKKRSERRKHCALAVVRCSQTFSPRRRPLPGTQDGQNLISWRWSLPLPTNPVW